MDRRRFLARAAAVTAVVAAAGRGLRLHSVQGASEFPASGALIGAWNPGPPLDLSSSTNFSAIDSLESSIAKRFAMLMWFQAWDTASGGLNTPLIAAVGARGTLPMISWEPRDPARAWSVHKLTNITRGDFDGLINQWASGLRAYGGPVYLRFAHEMNGVTYPWCVTTNGNTSSDYIAAWRHVHGLFAAAGATNVRWVWCPGVDWVGSGRVPYAQFYPGDAYVDVFGVTGFNGGSTLPWGGWQSFTQIFDFSIKALRALSSKPIAICEVASSESGGSKADWITDAFTSALPKTYPDVKAVVWFNQPVEVDWRIQSSQASLSAFRSAMQNPHWVATSTPAPTSTATATASPTASATPSPTSSPTPAPTAAPTQTPAPTPPPGGLQPPSDLRAAGLSRAVQLSWTPSAGAGSYRVYQGTSSGSITRLVGTATGGGFLDRLVWPGTTYYYQVVAISADARLVSARSNTVSATPTS